MAGFGVSAHDIEVKNSDGVTIYYKITSEAGLAVSYRGNYYDSHYNEYTGTVNDTNSKFFWKSACYP